MPTTQKIFQFLSNADRMVALMLLSLHAVVLVWDDGGLFYQALFLAHFGCFLLWQPIFKQSGHIRWQSGWLIALAGVAIVYFANWWILAFWVAILFALTGGKVLASSQQASRAPYLLAAIYLMAILLLWVVPHLLGSKEDLAPAQFILSYILPVLPLTILFLAGKWSVSAVALQQQAHSIDFFYTLTLFLMAVIFIFGSFTIGTIWNFNYIKSLIVVVLSIAVMLAAISWLWSPNKSFSGIELLMSRYLLTLGLPFELWIRKIAELADSENSPILFLNAAMKELTQLNWVSGVRWHIDEKSFQHGESSAFISTYHFHHLHLSLFSKWQFTPAMYLHVQLLTHVLSEFYLAKVREEEISQATYMQTVYETGSRLTHDIKNILQSIVSLSSAAEFSGDSSDPAQDAKLMELIKKQLPRLNQRLTSTLNKLERPSVERKQQAKVSIWWKAYKMTNKHYQVQFSSPLHFPKIEIAPDVLDSVLDNLIQNALEKAKQEESVVVSVALLDQEQFCIEVTDTGSAVPSEVVDRLFKAHISSRNGLGVGLYHAAQQASNAGYRLSLAHNQDGEVRFRLEKLD